MNRLDWVIGSFEYPQRLWWLLAIAICLAVAARAKRTGNAWWREVGQGQAAAQPGSSQWQLLDLGLGCIALILIVVAVAAPLDGYATSSASQANLQIVCLLDRSRSMLVQDVDGSRLELSRQLIRSVVVHAPGAAIAVASFAGRAHIDIPLTRDARGLEDRLSRITAMEGDLYGSNLAAGLAQAYECFASRMQSDKLLLIFSDGETHQPEDEFADPTQILDGLPPGTQAIVVCVGDQHRGGRIPLAGSSGQPEFLTYDGKTVYSLADPVRMRRLAASLGGDFLHPESKTAFDTVLQRVLRNFAGNGDHVAHQSARSIYLIPLRAAIVLFLVRLTLPWAWVGGLLLSSLRLRPTDKRAGFTTGLFLLMLVSGGAGPAANQVSLRQYIQRYNQGVEEFRKGSYLAAREAFSDAARTTEAAVRLPATFNLAGAIVGSAGQSASTDAASDIRQAIELYRQCLQAGYRSEDARVNIQVAFGLLRGQSAQPPHESSARDDEGRNNGPQDPGSERADEPPSGGGRSSNQGAGDSGAPSAGGSSASAADDPARPLADSTAEQMLRDIRERERGGSRPAQSSPAPPATPVSPFGGKPW